MTLALVIGALCTGLTAFGGLSHARANRLVGKDLNAVIDIALIGLFAWAAVRLAVAAWDAS